MTKLILKDVRCSYVYIDKPGKEDKYSIQPLIEKGSENHRVMVKAIDALLLKKAGQEAVQKKGRYKLPLRDPENPTEEVEGEHYDGMVFFNAKSNWRPGIVNRQNEHADKQDIENYCLSLIHI